MMNLILLCLMRLYIFAFLLLLMNNCYCVLIKSMYLYELFVIDYNLLLHFYYNNTGRWIYYGPGLKYIDLTFADALACISHERVTLLCGIVFAYKLWRSWIEPCPFRPNHEKQPSFNTHFTDFLFSSMRRTSLLEKWQLDRRH